MGTLEQGIAGLVIGAAAASSAAGEPPQQSVAQAGDLKYCTARLNADGSLLFANIVTRQDPPNRVQRYVVDKVIVDQERTPSGFEGQAYQSKKDDMGHTIAVPTGAKFAVEVDAGQLKGCTITEDGKAPVTYAPAPALPGRKF